MTQYPEEFYEKYEEGVRASARAIVPLILRLLTPRSVLDVGCGTGVWLSEFQAQGVMDVFGVDGDWLPAGQLKIPSLRYRAVNLLSPGEPIGKFDIALCLEVAEHIEQSGAPGLVKYLTKSAPFIIFSAAIPRQGGIGHVNEQWPEYWQEMFSVHDYHMLDPIRATIWDNKNIDPWYRQNLFVFANIQADAGRLEKLKELHSANAVSVRAVHPELRIACDCNDKF